MTTSNGQAVAFGRVPYGVVDSGAVATMTPAAVKVYVVLCAHARADWTARPSLKRIAKLAGLTEQGAIGGIKALEQAGTITVRRTGKGGRSRVNVYQLNTQQGLSVSGGETLNGGARKHSTAARETLNGDSVNTQPPLSRTERTERTEHATEAGDAAAADFSAGGDDAEAEVTEALNVAGVRGTNAGRCARRLLEVGTAKDSCRWVKQRRREISTSAKSAAAVLVSEIVGKNAMSDAGLRIVLEDAGDDSSAIEIRDPQTDEEADRLIFGEPAAPKPTDPDLPRQRAIQGRLHQMGYGTAHERCHLAFRETDRVESALAKLDAMTGVNNPPAKLRSILNNGANPVEKLTATLAKALTADHGPSPHEQRRKLLQDTVQAAGLVPHRKPDPNAKPLTPDQLEARKAEFQRDYEALKAQAVANA